MTPNLHTECLHYAALGYSRTKAADLLGYSRPHFTASVLPRIDPGGDIPWPSRGWSAAHREAVRERRGRGDLWRERISEAARRRPRKTDKRREQQMVGLWQQGWHQREIADVFGVVQTTVSQIIKGKTDMTTRFPRRQARALSDEDMELIQQLVCERERLRRELDQLTNKSLAVKFNCHKRTIEKAIAGGYAD